MRLFVWLTASILALSLAGCKKVQVTEPVARYEYVAFGHFFGECMGEGCIEIFKIEGAGLYEDTTDMYPSAHTRAERRFVPLTPDKYRLVKDFQSKIPPQLFFETNTVIGHPDGGDWGGVYLEVLKDGKRRYWLIDMMKQNIPSYLHGLVDEIKANTEKLR